MKNKLLILLILAWSTCFSQSVPNTTAFSLSNVQSVVGQNNLSACFASANSAYWDYNASITYAANSLLRFKNYGPKPLYLGGSSTVPMRENQSDCIQFMPYWEGSPGQTFGFTLSGNGITLDDIYEVWVNNVNLGQTLSGSFTIVAPMSRWTMPYNGYLSGTSGYPMAAIWVYFRADNKLEGTEYIVCTLTGGSSTMFNIDDTSYPTYVIPTVATASSFSSTNTTIAATGSNVTSDGGATVTARGLAYGTSSNPTISGSKTTDGSGTGTFNSTASSLTKNTTYYLRAYATNAAGTGYGSNQTYSTTNISVPTLATGSLLGRTYNQIHSGGIISADGGASVTARGICYSATQNYPSLTNSSFTSDGTGSGIYDSYAYGLSSNTFYYWRAYATNSEGTAYGSTNADFTLCSLSWSFTSGGTGDYIHISVNGTQVVSTTSTQSGTLSCAIGDIIEVIVDPGNRDYSEASLQINGAAPSTDIQYTPSQCYLSGAVNGNVVISASSHN